MTKQEFLAMSLPYGLKGIDGNGDIAELMTLDKRGYFATDLDLDEREDDLQRIDGNFKPIAHPLSDLTKPIKQNGEVFVPIKKIKELFIDGTEDVLSQSIEAIEYFIENNFFSRIEYLPFILIQKLIEWHFAVGLDENDYINVNTLEVNPYK